MKKKEQKTKNGLTNTLESINKSYGETVLRPLGDKTANPIDGIPSGAITIDKALGGFGIPKGRIIEILGAESSGKTTLALHIVAECQKQGGTVAYIDAEHALNPSWAEKIGVKVDDLIINQPDCGEQALDIVEKLAESGEVDLVVVDSVAALAPSAEISGEMGQAHIGLLARLMSQACRKLTALLNQTKTTVIFINQIRMKVGVMFGNPETTPGGLALKYYSSVRMDIRRVTTIKNKEGDATGIRSRVRVIKNKVAAPFQQAEFDIMFDRGIDTLGCLLDVATDLGYIQKAGAWFELDGEKYQGREKMCEFLSTHLDKVQELYTLCKVEA